MRDNITQFLYALIFAAVISCPMVAYFIIYGA